MRQGKLITPGEHTSGMAGVGVKGGRKGTFFISFVGSRGSNACIIGTSKPAAATSLSIPPKKCSNSNVRGLNEYINTMQVRAHARHGADLNTTSAFAIVMFGIFLNEANRYVILDEDQRQYKPSGTRSNL